MLQVMEAAPDSPETRWFILERFQSHSTCQAQPLMLITAMSHRSPRMWVMGLLTTTFISRTKLAVEWY